MDLHDCRAELVSSSKRTLACSKLRDYVTAKNLNSLNISPLFII